MEFKIDNLSISKPNSPCKIEKRMRSELIKETETFPKKTRFNLKDVPSPISLKTNSIKKNFLSNTRNSNQITYNNLLTMPYDSINNSNSKYLYLSRPKSNIFLLKNSKRNFNITNLLSHRDNNNSHKCTIQYNEEKKIAENKNGIFARKIDLELDELISNKKKQLKTKKFICDNEMIKNKKKSNKIFYTIKNKRNSYNCIETINKYINDYFLISSNNPNFSHKNNPLKLDFSNPILNTHCLDKNNNKNLNLYINYNYNDYDLCRNSNLFNNNKNQTVKYLNKENKYFSRIMNNISRNVELLNHKNKLLSDDQVMNLLTNEEKKLYSKLKSAFETDFELKNFCKLLTEKNGEKRLIPFLNKININTLPRKQRRNKNKIHKKFSEKNFIITSLSNKEILNEFKNNSDDEKFNENCLNIEKKKFLKTENNFNSQQINNVTSKVNTINVTNSYLKNDNNDIKENNNNENNIRIFWKLIKKKFGKKFKLNLCSQKIENNDNIKEKIYRNNLYILKDYSSLLANNINNNLKIKEKSTTKKIESANDNVKSMGMCNSDSKKDIFTNNFSSDKNIFSLKHNTIKNEKESSKNIFNYKNNKRKSINYSLSHNKLFFNDKNITENKSIPIKIKSSNEILDIDNKNSLLKFSRNINTHNTVIENSDKKNIGESTTNNSKNNVNNLINKKSGTNSNFLKSRNNNDIDDNKTNNNISNINNKINNFNTTNKRNKRSSISEYNNIKTKEKKITSPKNNNSDFKTISSGLAKSSKKLIENIAKIKSPIKNNIYSHILNNKNKKEKNDENLNLSPRHNNLKKTVKHRRGSIQRKSIIFSESKKEKKDKRFSVNKDIIQVLNKEEASKKQDINEYLENIENEKNKTEKEIISFIEKNLKNIKNNDPIKNLLNFPEISKLLQKFCDYMKILYENKKLDSVKVDINFEKEYILKKFYTNILEKTTSYDSNYINDEKNTLSIFGNKSNYTINNINNTYSNPNNSLQINKSSGSRGKNSIKIDLKSSIRKQKIEEERRKRREKREMEQWTNHLENNKSSSNLNDKKNKNSNKFDPLKINCREEFDEKEKNNIMCEIELINELNYHIKMTHNYEHKEKFKQMLESVENMKFENKNDENFASNYHRIKNEIDDILKSKEEEDRLNNFLDELDMQIKVSENKRNILKNTISLKDNNCQSIMGKINDSFIE